MEIICNTNLDTNEGIEMTLLTHSRKKLRQHFHRQIILPIEKLHSDKDKNPVFHHPATKPNLQMHPKTRGFPKRTTVSTYKR